jgi:hypothetical protein|nr:MAG TPA: hypothetical protein [Caudoviricetes sp.]
MTKGEERFGEVVVQRVILTPKISSELVMWIDECVEGRYYDDGHAIDYLPEYEVEDIVKAWENEEVEPEIVKELSEFVQYLQDEKVDYIMFPEGL